MTRCQKIPCEWQAVTYPVGRRSTTGSIQLLPPLWNSTWLSVNQKNQHPSPSRHVGLCIKQDTSCWEDNLRKPYFSFLWTTFLVSFSVISELQSLCYVWTSHPCVVHVVMVAVILMFFTFFLIPHMWNQLYVVLSLLSVRMLYINRKFCVLQWFFSCTLTPFCYSPISSSALLLSEFAPHYPPSL